MVSDTDRERVLREARATLNRGRRANSPSAADAESWAGFAASPAQPAAARVHVATCRTTRGSDT